MKQQTYMLSAADGTKLYTQSWLPDTSARGIIVLSHGYGEHSGRYQHVAQYFVEQGYAVYAIDHRGHGENHGNQLGTVEHFESISDDLRRFIEWVRTEQKSGPLFLLGHSMGGLLALRYTIQYQSMLKGLVLSGTMLIGNKQVPPPMRMIIKALNAVAPNLNVLSVDSGTLSKDPEVPRLYDADPAVYHGKLSARTLAEFLATSDYVRANLYRITLPIYILHGSADRLVPPNNSQVIYDNVGSADKTLKFYEGGYHEMLNEPEKARVLADIWVWLASHHGTSELRTAARK
jgi:acylglycerol lipase